MRINCSAGLGEFEHEECLKCSLTGNQKCGYSYIVLKALYGKDNDRPDIHVTDLTGCLRKAFLSKTEKVAVAPHELYTMMLGTIVHKGLETSDEHVQTEIPFAFEGVVGQIDTLYADGTISDIKTTRWLYPSKVPYGSHCLQVNIYAHYMRKLGKQVNRLQIQYLDLSGPTKCRACKVTVKMVEGEFKCPKCQKIFSNAHLGAMIVDVPLMDEQDIEERIEERRKELQAALDFGMAPEKEPGFLCGYCAFEGKLCWPEINDD